VKRVLVGINALTAVNNFCYASHKQEMFRIGRNYPEMELIDFTSHRTGIDNFRNSAALMALETECDYLYFIDDDMVLSPNTFGSLLKADKDVVMAQTFIRTYPFDPMYFTFQNREDGQFGLASMKDWEDNVPSDGLIKVDAIGCACVLIKTEVLKKMSPPYFVTTPGICTEDVYFCMKMKEMNEFCSIYVDTKVPTFHMMEPEFVGAPNVKELRKRYKEDNPEVVEIPRDRGNVYLEELWEKINETQSGMRN
jgi:glycosyltransferase involved in cell wall biosynthesis